MKLEARSQKLGSREAVDLERSMIGLVVAGLALLTLFAITVFIPAFQGTLIIDPVAVSFGPISVRWYGIVLATAILAAYEWSRRRFVAMGYESDRVEGVLWWAAISGILGARLGFVVQNFPYFSANLSEVLNVTQGGLSIHGAVIGGAIGAYLAGRRVGLSFWLLADTIAPTVLLGAIIGRLGNFLNYELYGYPTELPWKMFVPIAYRLPGYEAVAYFHPTFLYELLLNLVMLVFVLWYERNVVNRKSEIGNRTAAASDSPLPLPAGGHHSRTGSIFWLTIGLYSISRFTVEFFRIGVSIGAGLTFAQWVSLVLLVVALISLVRRRA